MQFARVSDKQLFRFYFRLPYNFCVVFWLPHDFRVNKTAEILLVLNIFRYESALQ